MNNNNNVIRTTYNHEDFGSLRVIYDAGKFYYCAKDVCRILKITGHDALATFCKEVKKEVHETDGGLHVMNFLGIDDVMRLYQHSKAENAEEFILSIDDLEYDFEQEFFGEDFDDSEEDEEYFEYDEDDNDDDTHDAGYLALLAEIGAKEEIPEMSPEIREFLGQEFIDNFIRFLDAVEYVYETVEEVINNPGLALKSFLTITDFNTKKSEAK